MRIVLAAALLAIAAPLGACGGDDESTGLQPIPAAGEFTPSADTPGVPAGASYDMNGNEWLQLEDLQRFEATQDYVADHPIECGKAAADPVRNYVDGSIGTDFPLNVPIAELLAEGCAAALQSGTQDLQQTTTAAGGSGSASGPAEGGVLRPQVGVR